MIKLTKRLLILTLLMCLVACDSKKEAAVPQREAMSDSEQEKSKYLAYVHDLGIELEESLIAQVHSRIVTSCQKDAEFSCVVLKAGIDTGHSHSSRIALRVKPSGVGYFSALASSEGKLSSHSSSAEDLGDKIVDNQKRLEMLELYRAKLEALESMPNDDIDTLIKVASELSKVQNEIEYAKGKGAKLLQRVDMDILNIHLSAPVNDTFFKPILSSLGEFGYEFSNGISSVIYTSAYLIPWMVFMVLMFFMLRGLYRLVGKRKNN